MRAFAAVAAAGLLASAAAGAAEYEPQHLQGAPGTPLPLAVETPLNPDCSPGRPPETRVVTPPAHGEITVREGRLQRRDGACPPALGYVVVYVPDADFTGDDTMAIEVVGSDGAHRLEFEVRVEGETTSAPPDAT